MTLSTVIPFMAIDEGKRQVLQDSVRTMRGYDELIIVSNWEKGYAKPINHGLKLATGDFLSVANDDLEWTGSMKQLCDENAVVSPSVNGQVQPFWGCAFVFPRWVYEKTGGLCEDYEVSYFDNDDFLMTLKKLGIKHYCNPQVNVNTKGGRTLDKFPNRNEFFEANKQKFEAK